MFWTEESDKEAPFVVPNDIVDLAFQITCPTLPLDHAHALSSQLIKVLPWLDEEQRAGIHLIHGAASGNGWVRPEAAPGELLHLSRRTRMRIRVPRTRLDEAQALTGEKLDIDGHSLEVGKAEVHKLSPLSTLFSRYVITREGADEEQFLEEAAAALRELDIDCRKMLCGITHTHAFPDRVMLTRSLMVAELPPEQSVHLQQVGLGDGRMIGCGLFIPHKGIRPVKENDDE